MMRIFSLLTFFAFLLAATPTAGAKGKVVSAPAPRPGAAVAMETPAEGNQLDSLSVALATTWGVYLRPALAKKYGDNPEAMNAYADGVKAAFTTDPSREPYFRGVLEGMQLAERLAQMKQMGVEPGLVDFNIALRNYLVSGKALMTPQQADSVINAVIASKMKPDTLSRADEQRFLDAQFKREGVVKFDNGLLMEVIREGEGSYPAPDDAVMVSYTGRLSDGSVFDHTDEPIKLNVDRVVAGMSEGLLQMKPGGKYRLFIPASLGYGPEGIPGIIPGNAVLDFTVDLLEILPKETQPAPGTTDSDK